MLHTVSSTKGRRFRLAGLALAAIIAVGLAGCTLAVNSGTGSGSSKPKAGGSIVVATNLDAQPSGIWGTVARNYPWLENVFQPLITIDPKTNTPTPLLATKWVVAADGRSVQITLRSDVTFQTGRKMTAADVKYTYQKAADPASGSNLGYVAKDFTSIDVTSPTQLTIHFSTALGNSLFDFMNQTLIVDQTTYAGLADGSQVVGTGPYKFGSWKPGASFTLTKYKGYWGTAPYLDSIQFVVTTDATAELSAVRSGRADIAFGLTASNAQTLSGTSQFSLTKAGGTIYPLGLNVTAAPFNNQAVRQAVGYAIDGQRINQQVFGKTGVVTDLPWGPSSPGYTSQLATHYSYNLAKAKQMIKAAGATGAKVAITYNASNSAVQTEYSIVANNLKAIGLVPTGNALDQPTFQADQAAGQLGQAFLSLHGQVGLSPATMAKALPVLVDGKNPSHFATPKYTQLVNALEVAPDAQASSAALQSLSSYMLDQAFVIPIVQAPGLLVVKNSVQGVSAEVRGFILFKSAYLSE
jgi:peptide/nickel transport system substrate-binding protein